jgi:hypothetical protein
MEVIFSIKKKPAAVHRVTLDKEAGMENTTCGASWTSGAIFEKP